MSIEGASKIGAPILLAAVKESYMNSEELLNYGPLASLIGTWEGIKGDDIAPGPNRKAVAKSKFREVMQFEPIGRVDNHEQILYGLRYRTTAWRLDQPDPFHEEVGYWLWDAKAKQIIRSFLVPRGVTVLAGGATKADSRKFTIKAKLGSKTYGICSNMFLDKEFKTTEFVMKVEIHSDNSFSYDETTKLKIKGQSKVFNHRDRNTLHKK